MSQRSTFINFDRINWMEFMHNIELYYPIFKCDFNFSISYLVFLVQGFGFKSGPQKCYKTAYITPYKQIIANKLKSFSSRFII